MGDIVFNIAKGKVARYSDLPNANDAVIIVLLKASGLEADGTLQDYDTLSAILAAANDEADFTGYSRKTLANVLSTVDDTNNRMESNADDPSAYTNSGSAQSLGKALIVYDPDTTGGTDADIIPLTAHDCVITADTGVPFTVSFHANGYFRAS